MDRRTLIDFASRYTAAWCSQNAASVAAFFAETGSLTINGGPPAVGRHAIAAAAQGFMTAFPDMVVTMDSIAPASIDRDRATYYWTLTGTNTGPAGTGRRVQINGFEEWTLDDVGLIARSLGHFDEAEYQRQLAAADAVPTARMGGDEVAAGVDDVAAEGAVEDSESNPETADEPSGLGGWLSSVLRSKRDKNRFSK